MKVKKRDGTIHKFDEERIFDAVTAAGASELTADNIINEVADALLGEELVSVERITEEVENSLMWYDKQAARNYIEYRSMRDRERQGTTTLARNVKAFLEQTDDSILNENANKSSRLVSTHRDLLAGILSKDFAKSILPEHITKAHELGKIHLHDQDYLISSGLHNCGVYDYAGMLETGFTLGNARIESPKSVGTATTILSQICSTISGSSYGGQSIHKYDEVLLPYVKKSILKLEKERDKYSLPQSWVDEKIKQEIYNAHQTFIYQINTICGSNGQSAFVTISLSLSEDPLCKLIKEQYLLCHMAGLGKDGSTPVFPKVIYFIKPDVNLNDASPNHDELLLAIECSCKRMYPDFVMYDSNLKMTGSSDLVTPMGKQNTAHLKAA